MGYRRCDLRLGAVLTPPDNVTARTIGACGAFGGVAPPLLNLAARFRSEGMLDAAALTGEMVSVAILATISFWFVRMHRETVMLKAFFLGVSAPALILNTASVADPPATRVPVTQEMAAGQGPSASALLPWNGPALYAASQDAASRVSSDTRSLTIQANLPVLGSIYIRDSSSPKEHKVAMDDDGSWTVPTSEFRVVYRGMIGGQVPIQTPSAVVRSGAEPVVLRIHIGQTFLGGILDGFGLDNLARHHIRADAKPEVASR